MKFTSVLLKRALSAYLTPKFTLRPMFREILRALDLNLSLFAAVLLAILMARMHKITNIGMIHGWKLLPRSALINFFGLVSLQAETAAMSHFIRDLSASLPGWQLTGRLNIEVCTMTLTSRRSRNNFSVFNCVIKTGGLLGERCIHV